MSTSPITPLTNDVEHAVRSMEGRSPADILLYAADRYFPRIGFSTGFGPEGCVILDLIGRLDLPIRVFTLDTGLLFPETYDLWRRLESHTGLQIEGVRPLLTLERQAEVHGDALWERDPDRCCQVRKIEPLKRVVAGLDAWISAIRRNQTADRADAGLLENDPRFGLVKVNPLATWTQEQVWDYLQSNGVPYNPLHEQGYPSIGCFPCTSPVRPGEHARAGRWRQRGKTECGLHLRVRPTQTGDETWKR